MFGIFMKPSKRVVWISHHPAPKLQANRLWNPSLIISHCGSDVQPLTFPVLRSYLQSGNWFLLQLCHVIAGRSILHHKTMKKKNVTANWKISTRCYWLSLRRSIVAQRELACRGNGQLEKYMRWCTGNSRRLGGFGGGDDEDNGFYTASCLTGDSAEMQCYGFESAGGRGYEHVYTTV